MRHGFATMAALLSLASSGAALASDNVTASPAPPPPIDWSQVQPVVLKIERDWAPPCDTVTDATPAIHVHLHIGADGRFTAPPDTGGAADSADANVAASAKRAVDVMSQAQPFPSALWGKSITVTLDAKEACAKR